MIRAFPDIYTLPGSRIFIAIMSSPGEQEYYLFYDHTAFENDDELEDAFDSPEDDEPYMSYDDEMNYFLEKEDDLFNGEDSYADR
jgi:hypothetical protein